MGLKRHIATAALLGCTASVPAHVMQQLSWFHVERDATMKPGLLRVHHECTFDKDVFRGNDPIIDTDGDTTASRHEIAQFCQQASNYVAQDFVVLVDGLPCPVRQESFAVNEDDTGFSSDIVADMPDTPTTGPQTMHIVDPSFMFTFPGDRGSTTTSFRAQAPLELLNDKGDHVPNVQLPRSPHVVVRVIRTVGATDAPTSGSNQ